MDRLEKCFGSRKSETRVERVIVDQNRAQQTLFRFDIVRCAPIGRSSRFGASLSTFESKGAMVLHCSRDFVGYGAGRR